MHCFQLLHLSDLHIAVRPRVLGFPDRRHRKQFPQGNRGWHHPSSYDPRLAEAVARYAWQNRMRFDAMLLSGDLAATGRKSDLGLARLHVEEPAANAAAWLTAQGWPTLAAAELPIFLMPGNHDRFRRIFHRPGAKIFDQTFNRSWNPAQRSPAATSGCVQSYPTLGVPTGEMVTFIAADFCLKKGADATRGWPGRWGQGRPTKAWLTIS